MHILIIPSEEFVPPVNNLAGIFQHDQAKILRDKGHQVGVISLSYKHSFGSIFKALIGRPNKVLKGFSFLDNLQLLLIKLLKPRKSSLTYDNIDGIKVLRCDAFWGIKSSSSSSKILNLWMKYGQYTLENYIKGFGTPDIIHAHNMMFAGLFISKLKTNYDIPIIITEHSSQYAMGDIDLVLEKELKRAYSKNKNHFGVSPNLTNLLNNRYNTNVQILPNVLGTIFESQPLSRNSDPNKFTILNVAYLTELKGQPELIEAFDKAFDQDINAELLIVGEGPLMQHLNEKIKEKNLEARVKLLGYLDRKEVIIQMDKANVFAFPSHYETFGVVLIEALSRGLPVVSTTCGGPECIVDQNNGILVTPKDVEELAQSLYKMYQTHHQYSAAKLREDVISNFGKEVFCKKLFEIYDDVNN